MSVHQVLNPSGARVYKVRWREHGRNRSRTFGLKRDAEAWDREVERRRQLGPISMQQLTGRGGATLGEWIVQRWGPEHGSMLAPSTRDCYANVYKVHIEPWLDQVPLTEITVGVLRTWQAERVKSGVRPVTIQKCRTLLSSVLRHAAESEAIAANPLSVVRGARSEQRDAVRPLAPATVEQIRQAMLHPAKTLVPASRSSQRPRRAYHLSPRSSAESREQDALLVSILAYAGLRPGELRALRWSDVREHTILVQRAANPDGSFKDVKNHQRRTVKLLLPLEHDLSEHRPRSAASRLILADADGRPWDKDDWQRWRNDRWKPACRLVGLQETPRPYDLRHSFASLLLAEGRHESYVSRQLGHSLAVLRDTYAHLIDEFEDAMKIDANTEILKAREQTHRTGALAAA